MGWRAFSFSPGMGKGLIGSNPLHNSLWRSKNRKEDILEQAENQNGAHNEQARVNLKNFAKKRTIGHRKCLPDGVSVKLSRWHEGINGGFPVRPHGEIPHERSPPKPRRPGSTWHKSITNSGDDDPSQRYFGTTKALQNKPALAQAAGAGGFRECVG
jgi:hypothetical protein